MEEYIISSGKKMSEIKVTFVTDVVDFSVDNSILLKIEHILVKNLYAICLVVLLMMEWLKFLKKKLPL